MRANCYLVGLLAIVALAGGASRPINEPITQFDPRSGYRPYLLIPKRQNNDPRTLFIVPVQARAASCASPATGGVRLTWA